MQSKRLILVLFAVLCSSIISKASEAYRSTSTFSSIAGECLLTVLDCLLQSPEDHSAMSHWGKVEDPASDCKFDCANEALSIQVPGTYHGLAPANKNLLAPRVLQDVAGDFCIEVKVKCFAPASGSSTIPTTANDNFVGSGILVWQDEKNFFRFMQAANSDQQQKVIQLRVGDQRICEYAYTFDAEYLHLRVFRVGKIFGASVSEDGKRWLALSLPRMPVFHDATYRFGDSLRAGVVVVNATNQEIQGEFKELKITHEPDLAVHDSFRTEWSFPKTPLTELRDPRVQQDLQLTAELLSVLKEHDAKMQALPVAVRLNEDSPLAQDLASKTWATIGPMLIEQQTKRLAGLAFQRHGPRSLLLDIVHKPLNLDERQLKSIASARKLLEEAVAIRNSSNPRTPESESKYRELRIQANELLSEVARDAKQEQADELSGDLFSFNLPGMIGPHELASGHPLGPLADLLRQPAVQQELRLSSSLAEAIDQYLEVKSREVTAVVETLNVDLSDNPSPPVVKAWSDAYRKIDSLRQELELECTKRLAAAQNSRLQQLLFQSLGPQTLLISDSAIETLELTAKQREDLQQIEERLAKSQNFSNLLCMSLRSAEDASVILSEQQREKLQNLKGATFRFVATIR